MESRPSRKRPRKSTRKSPRNPPISDSPSPTMGICSSSSAPMMFSSRKERTISSPSAMMPMPSKMLRSEISKPSIRSRNSVKSMTNASGAPLVRVARAASSSVWLVVTVKSPKTMLSRLPRPESISEP